MTNTNGTTNDKKYPEVVAVITAYKPSNNLKHLVLEVLSQCNRLVVADNSPHGFVNSKDILGEMNRVKFLLREANGGLAQALNDGIKAAGQTEFIFLLDQDSRLVPGTVSCLLEDMSILPAAGIVGPAPWDESEKRFVDPRTNNRANLAELPVLITSAMLIRQEAYQKTSGFRDSFFVDCVDQDFCLQVRRAGWQIFQDKRIILPHSLGEMRWHGYGKFKFRATHHPSWRLYWVARNGIILSKENFFFDFKWAVSNLSILFYWLFTILLFENPKIVKILSFFRGIFDGMLGRMRKTYIPSDATQL